MSAPPHVRARRCSPSASSEIWRASLCGVASARPPSPTRRSSRSTRGKRLRALSRLAWAHPKAVAAGVRFRHPLPLLGRPDYYVLDERLVRVAPASVLAGLEGGDYGVAAAVAVRETAARVPRSGKTQRGRYGGRREHPAPVAKFSSLETSLRANITQTGDAPKFCIVHHSNNKGSSEEADEGVRGARAGP
jgi:hypothetical protein